MNLTDTLPLRLPRLFGSDRMRPRITESEVRCFLLGCELGGSFDDGSQRISNLPGVFAVGVVDAPELVARLRHENVVRFHAAIRAGAACSVVPIAHNLLRGVRVGLLRGSFGVAGPDA